MGCRYVGKAMNNHCDQYCLNRLIAWRLLGATAVVLKPIKLSWEIGAFAPQDIILSLREGRRTLPSYWHHTTNQWAPNPRSQTSGSPSPHCLLQCGSQNPTTFWCRSGCVVLPASYQISADRSSAIAGQEGEQVNHWQTSTKSVLLKSVLQKLMCIWLSCRSSLE